MSATLVVGENLKWLNDLRNNGRSHVPVLRTTVPTASPEEIERIQQRSRALEGATPEEILTWAVDRYFPRFTMATGLGPEGCLIISMLAKIEPRVYVFNLETGYQFPETLELRERITEKYGMVVDLQRPEFSVEEYEKLHGGPLYKTNPNQCCYDRKVVVLHRVARNFDAWASGIRRDQERLPGRDAHCSLGRQVWTGQDQPVGLLDQEGRMEADRRGTDSVQPATRSRLPKHRLPALHLPGDGRRGRAGRPLERPGQDGMWIAHAK